MIRADPAQAGFYKALSEELNVVNFNTEYGVGPSPTKGLRVWEYHFLGRDSGTRRWSRPWRTE